MGGGSGKFKVGEMGPIAFLSIIKFSRFICSQISSFQDILTLKQSVYRVHTNSKPKTRYVHPSAGTTKNMNHNTFTHPRGEPPNVEVSPREELVLLALYGKELYGLQIPQAMEEASGGQRQMGIGTLYPVLHSLEKKGLVESRWGDEGRGDRGGARRRYYKLTGSGVAVVNSVQNFRNELMGWQPS